MADQEILDGPAFASGGAAGRAADALVIPGAAMTGGQLVDSIGDGELSAELFTHARDLAVALNEVGGVTGAKVKGSITIKIDVQREDNIFKFGYDIKSAKPKLPKPKSVMWCDEHNRFTRFPPNQGQFFGVRSAGDTSGGGIRRV